MRPESPRPVDSSKTRCASTRRASEFDPPNRQLAAKVVELERTIRDQIEASRPATSVQQMREQASSVRTAAAVQSEHRHGADLVFNQASLRDIFDSIAKPTGINITFDSTFQDRVYTLQLNGVTLEQALNPIVTANQLFYKVLDPKTILVIPDNAAETCAVRRAAGSELLHLARRSARARADAEPGDPADRRPAAGAGDQRRTRRPASINVRATTAMMAIIERMIESNDKPRAEVIVDVADPRSQSRPRQAVRHRPRELRDQRRVLARSAIHASTDQRPASHR